MQQPPLGNGKQRQRCGGRRATDLPMKINGDPNGIRTRRVTNVCDRSLLPISLIAINLYKISSRSCKIHSVTNRHEFGKICHVLSRSKW